MKSKTLPCPCHSEKSYNECCRPFHQGSRPDTALQLMRSRYAAHALCLPEYIIQTTHPQSPHFCTNTAQWTQDIKTFSISTAFVGLTIVEVQDKGLFATVTFTAHLLQAQKDVSFTEKSLFEKVQGQWLYHSRLS